MSPLRTIGSITVLGPIVMANDCNLQTSISAGLFEIRNLEKVMSLIVHTSLLKPSSSLKVDAAAQKQVSRSEDEPRKENVPIVSKKHIFSSHKKPIERGVGNSNLKKRKKIYIYERGRKRKSVDAVPL